MNAIICFKVVFVLYVLALCLRGIVVFAHTVPLLRMVLEPTGVSKPVKCFYWWFSNGVCRLVRSDGSLQLILFYGVGFFYNSVSCLVRDCFVAFGPVSVDVFFVFLPFCYAPAAVSVKSWGFFCVLSVVRSFLGVTAYIQCL